MTFTIGWRWRTMATRGAGEPLLLPVDSNRTGYHGFIQSIASSQCYEVRVTLPEAGAPMKHARLEVDWKLQQLLQGHLSLVQKRLEMSSDVSSFMVELQNIIERLSHGKSHTSALLGPRIADRLISDLRNVGWQNIAHVSPQLNLVKIRTNDVSGRVHILTVQLSPTQYPGRAPSLSADTPLPFQPSWSPRSGLVDLIAQFSQWLHHFQSFWDALDQVDTSLWVLEPEKPTRADAYRRIVIGHNLSLRLLLSPTHPRAVPEITFLGPDHDTLPLKQKLNQAAQHWKPESSLLENLSASLGLSFPSRDTAQSEAMVDECEICYAHQLDGSAPDITCDHCAKPFHLDCLFEWLKTVNVGKQHQRTNVIVGECPYCCQRLSISSRGNNRRRE